ncbi:MAG TPA: YCF48-related protein [Steroidobacteraceae bacterium]|nr:YCF48-related protein [Steroidobacteraceae bacterium]
MTKTQCALIAAAGLLAPSQSVWPQAEAPTTAIDEYSEIEPLAPRSLLLDAVPAGAHTVVVGERGHVLLSDDQGATWRQAKVPTRALLTAVYFHDAKLGWAVGHDETILRSEDGGETWTRTHAAPEREQPLLDVWFKDADTGYAFGAYGTILASTDGGRSWTQQPFEPKPLIEESRTAAAKAGDEFLDEGAASDSHLNAVARAADGKLYLAAEAGHLFRSDDDGASWLELPSPYKGSFFGVLPLDGATVLAFGLRGHLFRSEDAGATWREIPTSTVAMLTNALRLDSQTVVITGLAGTLLVSRDGGATFELKQQEDRKGIAAALPAGNGRLLVVGEGGVKVITP